MADKWWCVYSPEMMLYPGSCNYADPGDPPEYGACAVELAAPTAREAIKRSIKDPLMRQWVEEQRADNRNPFVGLKAELLADEPPQEMSISEQEAKELEEAIMQDRADPEAQDTRRPYGD